MKYSSNGVPIDNFIKDQWTGRLITNNKNIPMYFLNEEHGLIKSVFDMYANFATKIPESFSLTQYQPELNYYLVEVMKMSYEDAVFG